MRGHVARVALTWGLVAGLAGCGGGAGTPAAPEVATVGAEGGQVAGPDGVRLTVPPGSLAAPVTLRIARDTTGLDPSLAGGTTDPSRAVAASPIYALTPHGTTFAQPVELRIPLDAAAAKGPGTLVALRTEPGRTGWDVLPIKAVEGGAAIVSINTFSFYKVIKLVTLLPAAPPALEMSMTLGGASPTSFVPHGSISGQAERRLYGTIANRGEVLRLSGRVVGLPASCSRIALAGNAGVTQDPAATDSRGGFFIGFNDLYEPIFAEVQATAGTDLTAGVTRPTLTFAFDLDVEHAPYQAALLHALQAAGLSGPTPPVALSFNAFAICTTPFDMGGGLVLQNWLITPGLTQEPESTWGGLYFDSHSWAWNTILFTTDYLPQGFVTHPEPVTVAAGAPASFSTRVWPVPVGEQRIEWWRSDNSGVSWTNVRRTIVSTDTADTYTIDPTLPSDDQALIRARFCAVPRTPSPPEACTDGIAARLTVLAGVTAATFSQQPRAVLVRTGQTASFGVVVAGSPAPSVRWQTRPANSGDAWAEVVAGSGGASASYTTPPLALGDNGLQVRAVASNLAGDVPSEPVTASVSDADVAPTVTAQPSSLSVAAGSDAAFAVVARGTEALSYQWRQDGAPLAGATGPVLRLTAVTAGSAGAYTVAVSNAAGSVVSEAAILTVSPGAPAAVAPSIVTQPAAVIVGEGDTATFAVGVSGTGPLTFQWRKDGAAIAGATAAAITLTGASQGDAGAYSVVVGNLAGSVASAAASLQVVATPPPVLTPPSLTTQPATLAVVPGGAATLAVAASGSGPLACQWSHDGAPVPGATGPVLTLASVGAADGGSYTVTVSNAAGSVTSNPAQLILIGAPTITAQPAAASVLAGSSATFSVTAIGTALGYQWLRNGLVVAGATGASYTTLATTLADGGAIFGVLVYNGAGVVLSQPATLTVTAAPVVVGPAQAGKLAAAYRHTCAIRADGTLACWGYGSSGQIGAGSFSSWPTPFHVPLPAAATAVAAGQTATCAIHGAGDLSCWGNGATTPALVAGFTGVKAVAVGTSHWCFVSSGGGVFCRGANSSGQLGDGTTTPSGVPVQVLGAVGLPLTGVAALSAGLAGTCALLGGGTVACWGAGIGSTAAPVPGLTGVTALSMGSGQPCALSADGLVRCWSGVAVPAVVTGLTGVTALASGSQHVCAVTADATVWCWGTAPMGNGNVSETQPTPTRVSGLAGVGVLAAGLEHTCALRTDRTLTCWGANSEGQLATGDTFPRLTPTDLSGGAIYWGP